MSSKDETGTENSSPTNISRRTLMGAGAVAVAAASMSTLATPHVARAQNKKLKLGFSTPFTGQDSFSGAIGGLNQGVKDFDFDLTLADAAFDVKKQNDQISALVASSPDALIIFPFDPVGSANAVKAAIDSKIPVFILNSFVPGANAVSLSMYNEYGLGTVSAQYLVDRLGGKGKIAAMKLGFNESWSQRHVALRDVVAKYPDIEIVADWSFDATGKTTARTAADSFIAAHNDLDAIWCAWDNAAMEASLATLASGKADRIFTTGVDGGPAAFEVLRSGGPFSFTCALGFYDQAYEMVSFVHQHLNGLTVPRLQIAPAYAVDKAVLDKAGPDADIFDQKGKAKELGWARVV